MTQRKTRPSELAIPYDLMVSTVTRRLVTSNHYLPCVPFSTCLPGPHLCLSKARWPLVEWLEGKSVRVISLPLRYWWIGRSQIYCQVLMGITQCKGREVITLLSFFVLTFGVSHTSLTSMDIGVLESSSCTMILEQRFT